MCYIILVKAHKNHIKYKLYRKTKNKVEIVVSNNERCRILKQTESNCEEILLFS